jgi:hypothetical protein
MERQLRTQRTFITWFGLTVVLLLTTAVSVHAQITVVQSVPMVNSYTQICGNAYTGTGCLTVPAQGEVNGRPATSPVTVSFAPTTSGNVLLLNAIDTIETNTPCIDNLGQTWIVAGDVSLVPPPGAVTGGITSLTCWPVYMNDPIRFPAGIVQAEFYEISGVAPGVVGLSPGGWDDLPGSSGIAACPASLPNSITFYDFTAEIYSYQTTNDYVFPPASVSIGFEPGYVGTMIYPMLYDSWWYGDDVGDGREFEATVEAYQQATGYRINGPVVGSPATFSYSNVAGGTN